MAMTETDFTSRARLRTVRGALAISPTPQAHAETSGDVAVGSGNSDWPGERLAYSVAEAALITGLSRDLLYDQMRTGKLAYLKVGRRRIITRRSLDAFLARPAS